MKKTKFSLKGFISRLAMVAIFMFVAGLVGKDQVVAQTYNIPNLKPVPQAIQDLTTEFAKVQGEAQQQGKGSALWSTVKIYQRTLDALINRPDQNMNTYSVFLSSLDFDTFGNLVVRNGYSIDMNSSIEAILNTAEYKSLIQVLKS